MFLLSIILLLTQHFCSIVLQKQGFEVDVYEKWPDMRKTASSGGRSINLVLTGRGLHAVDIPGLESLKDALLAMSVPVVGRMVNAFTIKFCTIGAYVIKNV